MHVLMIGGTRFMGRIAVRKLLEAGDTVTVFSRGNTKPDWWNHVEHIQGDRDEIENFKAKLKGRTFDAVIDTQAFVREHVESAVTALDGNLGRYLFVSTGSVYYDMGFDFFKHCPFKETDVDWSTIDYSFPEGVNPYGVGKRHCEKWLQESSPVPYTIVRIPSMLGEDDNEERSWWWSQRALDGGPIVIPAENSAVFRCLYAADAAEAWVRAIKSPNAANQTYHIASQEIITIEYWAKLVIDAAGTESVLTLIPLEFIHRQEGLENYAERLSRDFPCIHDLTKAEHDFGFTTTPVEQWVQSTVHWYRDSYEGEDAAGYEHRDAEIAVAAKWSEAHSKLVSGG